MKKTIYEALTGSSKFTKPENVPFNSTASGPLAHDFLLSKGPERLSKTNDNNIINTTDGRVSNSSNNFSINNLARLFEIVSRRVSDLDFKAILDDIENKVNSESYGDISKETACMPNSCKHITVANIKQ